VRKLVLYFCFAGLALGQTPQPTDTVLAWKPQTPYMHGGSGWPSLPHSLWTNSVLWLTEESPVLNEGATNANWICYAKTCEGNATQVDVNNQPTRVLTNGVWVLRFDGTDDGLYPPQSLRSVLISTNWTISVKVNRIENQSVIFGVCRAYTTVNQSAAIIGSSSTITLTWNVDSGGPGTGYKINSSFVPGAVYTGTYDGEFVSFYRSGVLVGKTAQTGTLRNDQTLLTVGFGERFANILGHMNGDISDLLLFNRALTSNEVWRLSQ
jgi:hypothetical protein